MFLLALIWVLIGVAVGWRFGSCPRTARPMPPGWPAAA